MLLYPNCCLLSRSAVTLIHTYLIQLHTQTWCLFNWPCLAVLLQQTLLTLSHSPKLLQIAVDALLLPVLLTTIRLTRPRQGQLQGQVPIGQGKKT